MFMVVDPDCYSETVMCVSQDKTNTYVRVIEKQNFQHERKEIQIKEVNLKLCNLEFEL